MGCEQVSGQKQPRGHWVSGPRCLLRGGGARLWPSTTTPHFVEGSGGIQKLLLLLREMRKRRGPRLSQSCKWMGRRTGGDAVCHSSVPGPYPGCRIHGSCAPSEGSGSSARAHEPQAAGRLMEKQCLHLGPRLPWRTPGGPLSTCRLLAVSLPAWLVQRTQTLSRGPGSEGPSSFHYLMKFLIVHLCPVQLRRMRSMPARPRFSTSRQRPVPLFMTAPFWEHVGVRGRRDSQRRRQRDGDGKTETETGTERQRDRNKEPERDRDKDGETDREIETDRERYRE